MFWVVFLYLVISVAYSIVYMFNDWMLGLSALFGSLLAVFAGGGLRGSLYGNKLQKIGGFVSAVIFMLIAYWLNDKFYFFIKGFSFTGLEWIIIGFFIGLLFVSKAVATGEKSKNPMRELSAYFWISLIIASSLWIFEGFQKYWFTIMPLFGLSIYLYKQYKGSIFTGKEKTTKNYYSTNDKIMKKSFFRKLLSGDFGLAKTYWLYGVLARIVIITITMIPVESILILVTQGLLITVYEIIVAIAIWQAANKYKGLMLWAILAKIAVVLGVILLIGDLLKYFN